MKEKIIFLLICLIFVAGCSGYTAVEKEAIDSCTNTCFELKEFQKIYTEAACQGKCTDYFEYGGIQEVQEKTSELKTYRDNLVKTRDFKNRNVADLNESLDIGEQTLITECSSTCTELQLIYMSEKQLGDQCWLGCYDILLNEGVSAVEQDINKTQATLNDIRNR